MSAPIHVGAGSGAYSNACGFCRNTANSGEFLMLCGGCRSEHYCNAACQKAGWNAGHKAECKARQVHAKDLLDRRTYYARETSAMVSALFSGERIDSMHRIPDVAASEQPPLVPGGPVIRAGGGRNWKYKADSPELSSPMLMAVARDDDRNDAATVKQLLERGEDVHARDSFGFCALQFVVARALAAGHDGGKCLPTIDVLLEYGADPNACDSRGKTVAHLCATSPLSIADTEAILRRLLDAGADLSLVDIDGYSAARSAARGSPLQQLLKRLEVEYAAKRKAWKQQLLTVNLKAADAGGK